MRSGLGDTIIRITALRCLPACLVPLLLVCLGPGSAADLVVGGDEDFAPFEFLDEFGQPAGFNVDLVRAIAGLNGLDAQIRLTPWSESRRAIAVGTIDVLPMFVDPIRFDDVEFAQPHAIVYHEIFVRIGSEPLLDLSALEGREIIVEQDGWIHERLIADQFSAELIPVGNETEALVLLASGAHDAAIVGADHGRLQLQRLNLINLTTSGPPLFPVAYALAVPVGRSETLRVLNQGLEALKATGDFNSIHARWLGREPAQSYVQKPEQGLTWWILAGLLLAALLAGLSTRVLLRRHRRSHAAPDNPDLLLDAVTGLPVRTALENRLLELAQGTPVTLHLLYIDVDQFRLINESSDHQRGDQVLRQIADLLKGQIEPPAFLVRAAGDEFCLLLNGETEATVLTLSARLLETVQRQSFEHAATRVTLSVSIGIAEAEDLVRDDIGEFIKQAETACEAAKAGGRNRVHRYHPEDEAVVEKHAQLRWIAPLEQALGNDSLLLYFQPIAPARPDSEAPLMIELLLRMRGPDGELISAGQFITAAERYFLAQRVDRWVLKTALAWLFDHQHSLDSVERVNINVSAQSLSDDRFLPYVIDLLERYPLQQPLLCFEITETAMMTRPQASLQTMTALHARGIHFAIDDFGAGYSSVALLQRLPIDQLKIDGHFVRQALNGERQRRLLSEFHDIGRVLNTITVAEMVEDEPLRQLVADCGFDYAQGWCIGRPQPLAALMTVLQDRRSGAGQVS